MKYYLVAGERSGDLHAGNLLRALKHHDADIRARGFGGDEMQSAGMQLTVHYNQLAFMGFTAVIANLSTISTLIKKCKADILDFKPDVVILVDYAGFNMRIAKFAKENNLRVFWYISPKVWAWNTKRALKLKAVVDRMFCILPFEKDFYKKFDWDVDYVGNPVLDAIRNFQPDNHFPARYNLEGKKIVALLPGSRRMELKRVVPIMAEVAKANTHLEFVVAAVKTLPPSLYDGFRNIDNVKLIFESTYDLLSRATAAIVTSGTATLETALFKVPEVLVYKTTIVEETIVRLLIKVRYIGLVNLIMDRDVVRELFQSNMTVGNLNAELDRLVNDATYRNTLLSEYEKMYQVLDAGGPASENAARLMSSYLKD